MGHPVCAVAIDRNVGGTSAGYCCEIGRRSGITDAFHLAFEARVASWQSSHCIKRDLQLREFVDAGKDVG
jgi:hypothetical protein